MGLNWSKQAADGSSRSIVSQIIDPVGACLQPADLAAWNPDAYEGTPQDDAAVPATPATPAPAPAPSAK